MSMNLLIGAPKRHINHAMTKNRNPRDTTDASRNMTKLMWNNPPVMVKSLIGQGSESRGEYYPEVVSVVQRAHLQETLHREYVIKEELRERGILAGSVLPQEKPRA